MKIHTLNACNLIFPCWKMYDGCMTIHELFFYLFFSEECVYKYMKFDFVFVLRMHVKMHEICLNMNFWFSSLWKMHIRMHEICLNMNFWFSSFWKMYIRMHEICLFFIFFIDEGMKFFWLNLKMHVWMHEIWFFVMFWMMHLWMH